MIQLVNYQESYLNEMAIMMKNTIEIVNREDYDARQIHVWANRSYNLLNKNEEFLSTYTLIAVDDQHDHKVVGFGNIDSDGYIDFLYIHAKYIHHGIGKRLVEALEKTNTHFSVHASITAKGFFEKMGYTAIQENHVDLEGIDLINYTMVKND